MTLPFDNIRILAFCHALAGNTTAMYLSELGAEVVKIESWTRPDPTRNVRQPDVPPAVEKASGAPSSQSYISTNRSLKGITIDMSVPEGRAVFSRLASVADIVLDNFGIGVMQKWGLESEDLRKVNPDIITLSMPGLGKTGPKRSYITYGSIISSFTGMTHMWGYSHGTHNDYATAAFAAYVLLGALQYRDRTGKGLSIDLAQSEAGANLMGPLFLDATVNRRDPKPYGNRIPGSSYSAVLKCRGFDRWIAIELETEADWKTLCSVMKKPALAADPRFASLYERTRNIEELDGIVEAWLQSYTPHQAMLLLQKAGLAACAVQDAEDLYHDPQLWSRDFIVETADPDMGSPQFPQSVHRLSKTPGRIRRPAPRLGEHTDEILSGWIDMPEEERARLKALKVI